MTFDGDRELYAIWRPSNCTITFNPNGGTGEIQQRVVQQGSRVGELPTTDMPKLEGLAGMEFAGWWTAAEGGTQVTSETVVPIGLSEITLYAQWLGVIHYQRISKNTDQRVTIENGVASGFYGSVSSNIQCVLLETIEDDKFDFSGEFDIVMRCQVTYNRTDYNATWNGNGASRCDVFGIYYVEGSQHCYSDFGILNTLPSNIKYTQWEIASNYNDQITVGPYHAYGESINKIPPAG